MRNHATPLPFSSWAPVLCLLTVSLLSCAPITISNVGVGEIVMGESGEVLMKDYVIKDKVLAKEVAVEDLQARYVGPFLEGLVVIKNRKVYTQKFEYKFEWYDKSGLPIDSNTTLWVPLDLYGAETKWIRSTCPKPDATGFKVMIREAHPITK